MLKQETKSGYLVASSPGVQTVVERSSDQGFTQEFLATLIGSRNKYGIDNYRIPNQSESNSPCSLGLKNMTGVDQ